MKLLTTRQAAEHLGIKERQVRNLIHAQVLPAERFGWVYMIREKDLPKAENRPGLGRRKKIAE